MQRCIIYNKSLRFSKTVYGILALFAFLSQNFWFVFIISVLMIFEMFSVKLNFPYQLHVFVLKRIFKKNIEPIQKEKGELIFVCGLAGAPLFLSFLLLHFGKFIGFAWSLVLVVSLLLLLSGVAGFCVASLSYVIFKKLFKW